MSADGNVCAIALITLGNPMIRLLWPVQVSGLGRLQIKPGYLSAHDFMHSVAHCIFAEVLCSTHRIEECAVCIKARLSVHSSLENHLPHTGQADRHTPI